MMKHVKYLKKKFPRSSPVSQIKISASRWPQACEASEAGQQLEWWQLQRLQRLRHRARWQPGQHRDPAGLPLHPEQQQQWSGAVWRLYLWRCGDAEAGGDQVPHQGCPLPLGPARHHHGRRRDLALFRAGWRPGVNNRAMNTIMEDWNVLKKFEIKQCI